MQSSVAAQFRKDEWLTLKSDRAYSEANDINDLGGLLPLEAGWPQHRAGRA